MNLLKSSQGFREASVLLRSKIKVNTPSEDSKGEEKVLCEKKIREKGFSKRKTRKSLNNASAL